MTSIAGRTSSIAMVGALFAKIGCCGRKEVAVAVAVAVALSREERAEPRRRCPDSPGTAFVPLLIPSSHRNDSVRPTPTFPEIPVYLPTYLQHSTSHHISPSHSLASQILRHVFLRHALPRAHLRREPLQVCRVHHRWCASGTSLGRPSVSVSGCVPTFLVCRG
jgi:hypothetical protein